MNPEEQRLQETRDQKLPWKKGEPYLSERQWGTVREDYSDSGDAWNCFSHDQSRSWASRWGEDVKEGGKMKAFAKGASKAKEVQR